MRLSTRRRPRPASRSAFAGFRFPADVIVVAVRWYLRYGLSYRDIEELLAERRVQVDHVTVYRWVQRLTPLLADAARFCRHSPGDRWFVDETYVKVNGVWRYVYQAVDQQGQIIDVLVSNRRDEDAVRRFFGWALTTLKVTPSEVVTDAAPVYPRVLDDLVPAAWAPRGTVCQQPRRVRPRPPQTPATTHARPPHRPHRRRRHLRTRVPRERPPRPLRTRPPNDPPATSSSRVRRTRPSGLIPRTASARPSVRECNSARPGTVIATAAAMSRLDLCDQLAFQDQRGHPQRAAACAVYGLDSTTPARFAGAGGTQRRYVSTSRADQRR